VKVSRAHNIYDLFRCNKIQVLELKCAKLRNIMTQLALLFGIHEILKDSVALYESGYFDKSHGILLR